jgi:hypothetical protein
LSSFVASFVSMPSAIRLARTAEKKRLGLPILMGRPPRGPRGRQGWVLEYNQLTSAWHIFLLCFLRNVSVPSEHMVVMSCIPMSLTFSDFLLANRCGTLRSLSTILNLMLNVKCYTWLLYTANYFICVADGKIPRGAPQCFGQDPKRSPTVLCAWEDRRL